MHELVVSTLEESAVNGAEQASRPPLPCQPQGHSVLFCDTNIKCTLRKPSADFIQASTTGHSGCDGSYIPICLHDRDKTVGKYTCETRRLRLRNTLFPCAYMVTPCILSLAVSAGGYPLPLMLFTCRNYRLCQWDPLSLMFSKIGTRFSMS